MLIGFTAGTLACCVNIPFDVAKSRIQGPQPDPGVIKYRGTMKVMTMVYKEEGYFILDLYFSFQKMVSYHNFFFSLSQI